MWFNSHRDFDGKEGKILSFIGRKILQAIDIQSRYFNTGGFPVDYQVKYQKINADNDFDINFKVEKRGFIEGWF